MNTLITKRLRALLLAFAAWGMVHESNAAMQLRDALGHFESGATTPSRCSADAKVGSRREVSRFQILPSVWRQYSQSGDFRNPDVAWSVTEKILTERHERFTRATGREWDAIDLYIMWNAPGVYEKVRWDRRKVSRVVMERAQRFSNLMMRDETLLAQAGNP
jgi:hypothetical protein